MKSSKIAALENYGITKSELYKLGGVLVKVCAYMDSFKLTPAVIRCEPKDILNLQNNVID